MNKTTAYKNIAFFKKEFDDNFLLLNNNKTLSVGFLVKDILLFLQNGIFNPLEIKDELFKKHNLIIETNDIEKTISVIDEFAFADTNSFFLKFGKLINPSIVNLKFNFLFSRLTFYYSFIFILFLNLLIFITLQQPHLSETKDWLIWLLLLLLVLFFHELGHSLAAKRFGVTCKEIGMGLYTIFPILYTNLGESWKLKRYKRIIINLSGIYFQLILGVIIGSLGWLTNSNILSYLFFSNISIIFFNLNPFIKLDGYWVASDLLNTYNLSKEANKELSRVFSLNFKGEKHFGLLIYSFFRLIFIISILILTLNLIFSLAIKIYKFIPLSYYEYFFIVIILFYIFKYLKKKKNGLGNRKKELLKEIKQS